jgi:hypothetical protein
MEEEAVPSWLKGSRVRGRGWDQLEPSKVHPRDLLSPFRRSLLKFLEPP